MGVLALMPPDGKRSRGSTATSIPGVATLVAEIVAGLVKPVVKSGHNPISSIKPTAHLLHGVESMGKGK